MLHLWTDVYLTRPPPILWLFLASKVGFTTRDSAAPVGSDYIDAYRGQNTRDDGSQSVSRNTLGELQYTRVPSNLLVVVGGLLYIHLRTFSRITVSYLEGEYPNVQLRRRLQTGTTLLR